MHRSTKSHSIYSNNWHEVFFAETAAAAAAAATINNTNITAPAANVAAIWAAESEMRHWRC